MSKSVIETRSPCFSRCERALLEIAIFGVLLVLFMHVQQLMYPSEAIFKVHTSIQHNFDVAAVDDVSDVSTMFEYIETFQKASRQFSPASSDYAADYRQRIFVSLPELLEKLNTCQRIAFFKFEGAVTTG